MKLTYNSKVYKAGVRISVRATTRFKVVRQIGKCGVVYGVKVNVAAVKVFGCQHVKITVK